MASELGFKKAMALLFVTFPDRKPAGSVDEIKLALDVWRQIFACLTDDELLVATGRFVRETKKIFPGDNPMAAILDLAKPKLVETSGDVIELAEEAVGKFGFYRVPEAMAWLEDKSSLCAAAIRRFGFREFCSAENAEVARGQLKAIFLEEKRRAESLGGVVRSAVDLNSDEIPAALPQSKFLRLVEKASEKMVVGRANTK